MDAQRALTSRALVVAFRKVESLVRKSRRMIDASVVAEVGKPEVRILEGKVVKLLLMLSLYIAFAAVCQRRGSRTRKPAVSMSGESGIVLSRETRPVDGRFP